MSSPPIQTAVHELMRMIMDGNKEKDRILIQAMSGLNTGRQVNMLPDLKQNIRSFDGEFGDCMITEEWLNSINITSNLYYWPEEYKLKVARANLTGVAKNWYLANLAALEANGRNLKNYSRKCL